MISEYLKRIINNNLLTQKRVVILRRIFKY